MNDFATDDFIALLKDPKCDVEQKEWSFIKGTKKSADKRR